MGVTGQFECYLKVQSWNLDDEDDYPLFEVVQAAFKDQGVVRIRFKGKYDKGNQSADFSGMFHARESHDAYVVRLVRECVQFGLSIGDDVMEEAKSTFVS